MAGFDLDSILKNMSNDATKTEDGEDAIKKHYGKKPSLFDEIHNRKDDQTTSSIDLNQSSSNRKTTEVDSAEPQAESTSSNFDKVLMEFANKQEKAQIQIKQMNKETNASAGDDPLDSFKLDLGSDEEVELSFDDLLAEFKPDVTEDSTPTDSTTNSTEIVEEIPYTFDGEQELDNLNIHTPLLSDFRYTDIQVLVDKFLDDSSRVTFPNLSYNTDKKDLIVSSHKIPALITLYNVLNIRANKQALSASLLQTKATLTGNYDKLIKKYDSDKMNIETEIKEFMGRDLDKLAKILDGEMSRLTVKREEVKNILDSQKQIAVSQELDKSQELFDKANDLAKEVAVIKKKITRILGTNFAAVTDGKITMPETQDELEDLLDEVTEAISLLELNDKSYYHMIMKKALGIIYFPSSLFEGEIRSIVVLLNTLAFIILMLKFRDIAVFAFSATILTDLIYQARMAEKNQNADFVIEFATKAEEIIEGIKSGLIADATSEYDSSNREFMKRFDEKVVFLSALLTEAYDAKVSEIKASVNRSELLESVENKYEHTLEALDMQFEKIKSTVEQDYQNATNRLEEAEVVAVKEAKELPQEEFIECDNRMQLVFKPKVKVGDIQSTPEAKLSFARAFREGSYIIRVKDNAEKLAVFDKVKHMTLQLLNTMRPEYLRVNFVDMSNMGNDFMELISENEEISRLIPNEDLLTEHLGKSIKEIEKRYKQATKEYEDVTAFNTEMASRKAVTLKYELNIFLNFNLALFTNSRFRTLMSEGGKSGFSSIAIVSDEDLLDSRGEMNKEALDGMDCFNFRIAHEKTWRLSEMSGTVKHPWRGSLLPEFPHLSNQPVQYDRSLALEKMKYLEKIASENAVDLVLYEELKSKYAPELFKLDTLKGIQICVGFRDGDLTKPEYVELGDELVHALMSGKTGAGKSNTINVILMNLISSYSPEWLELFMIDFKNVEFNFYTNTVETPNYTKKVCMIPHTSMIAGTTDAEYSLSVFETALKKMNVRKKILAKGIKIDGEITTFKKIEDYNSFVIKHGIKEDYPIIPRILILLDEFQVMFQIEDDDVITKIKGYITRLSKEARSMGMHMFFTSQSMEGTLSDDVKGQFAMRWCLSATKETSKEVLGNEASGSLKGKGFIYMSGTMERKEEDNKLFKVPFIPPDYIINLAKEIKAEAKRLNKENPNIPVHEQEFFDEKDTHSEKELNAFLVHPNIKAQTNAMLLGPKVVYRDRTVPEHFMIGHDDMENIAVTGNDKVASANLINTMLKNFASKEQNSILIANFDRTMDGLVDESLGNPSTAVFNRISDPLPVFEALQDMLRIRLLDRMEPDEEEEFNELVEEEGEKTFDPKTDKRLVVFLIGLHKAQGFNESYIEDEYSVPFLKALKNGPARGITFVMNFKAPSRLTTYLPQFSYRVSSKIDDDLSYELYNNRRGKNLYAEGDLNFGLFRSTVDDSSFKFKIYNFAYDKALLKPKEIADVII